MIKLILTFIFCVFSFSFAEETDQPTPTKDQTAIAAPISTTHVTDTAGDPEYEQTSGKNKPKNLAEGKLAPCTLKGTKCDPLTEGKATDKKGTYTTKPAAGSNDSGSATTGNSEKKK